jgi:hypothetical protein
VDILNELYQKGVSRRNFMLGASALGATSALAGCSGGGTIDATVTGISDTDILNFALNLEYLEAEFFLNAATGSGLASTDITGTGTQGAVTGGGTAVPGLTSQQQDFINEMAYTEQQHVRFLRSALGSAAIAIPAINIGSSFGVLAAAAGLSSTFSPYTSYDAFLVGAFIFEDVGVTAYTGSAPLISPAGIASGLLSYAAGLQAVEAYHAGSIRTQITAGAIAAAQAGTSSSFPYLSYANAVSTLRGTLGGGNETPLTVPVQNSGGTFTASSIVQASPTTAIGYGRSFDQILHIVYGTGGGAGVSSGGFFPSGVNGAYTVTQS